MERKVFNKTTPTEGGKHFIPLPSDARHYIHHDRINADKLFLYALIIDYYNLQEGFAFPSLETLSVKYGKVPDTTSKHLDDLKEVGLINFPPEKGYYVPLIPLTDDDFFTAFPDAWGNYKEAIQRCDNRRKAAAERMRKWRQENGYTD
ncbi:helix-turn-helix domain-containing protein [Bacillus sp. ISL-40]|uniref:helix-turn-helix domain-containing protein n=1 Tax=unclassified Bacillus (in: firmicutes) TaxID=185979 RepID=UPI001BECE17F|nr:MULTISPECIES: helix-turn-helix domain-containing protein [unclassified Bacillus (in: firmicutes)]MBT2700651.1 helix-turn-helix domain-containing protein [Bacillus sp. ISL-40]MBT2722349.1 helix-turn-helix domain-containing protein [Bacillus sp. ISL-46]MBT2743352.1 helix-turn-helix domain-containing protein [Bacillus sp. ISL-77]